MPPQKRPDGPLQHWEVREQLDYDPETGHFTWIVSKPRVTLGMRAGLVGAKEYICITICGREYKGGPLAWFWMTGQWPKGQVDHRNRDRSDNRWGNLRDTTQGQNQMNTDRYGEARSISSYMSKRKGMRYILRMRAEGRNMKETFDTLAEAQARRKEYQARIWGEEFAS